MPKTDIVITSFNGLHLLKKQLPVVIANSGKINHIIVVDDASTDDTVKYLEQNYPQILCIHNHDNLGFTRSTIKGVDASNADYVVLLNNDVYPQKDYLKSSIKILDNPLVFAVTFNEIHSSWPQVSWSGKLSFSQGNDKTKPRLSAWASGGSSILKKKIWNELGGMNPIYTPGYWEDIDLGWRAWKAGYQIVWDPKSIVEHVHESTFGKLNPHFIAQVKQRNELLFNWQNISDPTLTLSHLKYLITYSITHPGFLKIILAALKKLPGSKSLSIRKVTDTTVLNSVNQIYDY